MIFFWKGFGILVPLIWFAAALIVSYLVGPPYYEIHGWPKLVAGLVAAVVIGWAGSKLNENRPQGNRHSFFFLDMEIWALISVIGGIVLAVKS
jgi:hypothetical protein